MKRSILIILIIFFGWLPRLQSNDIRIGLFYDHLLQSFTFHGTSGSYVLLSGNDSLTFINPSDIYFFSRDGAYVAVNNGQEELGRYRKLQIREVEPDSRCRLKAVEPSLEPQNYAGDFQIDIVHEAIRIINEVDFDTYLAGVVEAEAGARAPGEFYKAQAVICRTYALKNWNNHYEEGFNLCDETHCQVYHGISDENPEIYHAVLSTHNVVLADRYSRLIIAAYHSNSGGETQKASAVWPNDFDYLQAIIDPYSKDQRNYQWKDALPLEVWMEYLKNKGLSLKNVDPDQTFIKQNHRRKHLILNDDTLSIATIRNDLGFKSAFFDMVRNGDTVMISGKGYGHGVGLSQEGAMEMAREGYSFSDILRFYYYQVKILDIHDLPASELPDEFE